MLQLNVRDGLVDFGKDSYNIACGSKLEIHSGKLTESIQTESD